MATKKKADPEEFFFSPHGHVKDRIILHETQELSREGKFMSLNGYGFLAKPNVEIDLPRAVRLMLDTRVYTETRIGDDGREYTRDIQRMPYTLVKLGINLPEPTEEVAEQKEETF